MGNDLQVLLHYRMMLNVCKSEKIKQQENLPG